MPDGMRQRIFEGPAVTVSSNRRYLAGSVALALLAGVATPNVARAEQVGDVSFDWILDTPGLSKPYFFGISGDGSTLFGQATIAGPGYPAFLWTKDGITQLEFLPNGGDRGAAYGANSDASVIVGESARGTTDWQAVRWVYNGEAYHIESLGILDGGDWSQAVAVSDDGSVIVGSSDTSDGMRAARWTDGSITSLGVLAGGTYSYATGVSGNGTVIAGTSYSTIGERAFRWTEGGGMSELGVLDGYSSSEATAISNDGNVIVGYSEDDRHVSQAFRWTAQEQMVGLGFLEGGDRSVARDVSADGSVIVGYSIVGGNYSGAFVWTDATGEMRSLAAILTEAGLSLDGISLIDAIGVSDDGTVIVGKGTLNEADRSYIARIGSGQTALIDVAEMQQSLASTSAAMDAGLGAGNLIINGGHSHPLASRIAPEKQTAWIAGDVGVIDRNGADGAAGFGEFGLGRNFGPVQVNLSGGFSRARQDMPYGGRAEVGGYFIMSEALVPLRDDVWATFGGYADWGSADIRRGYLNGAAVDHSAGSPDSATYGFRARLDWDQGIRLGGLGLSPFADFRYTSTRLDAYTETGGAVPATFDARTDHSTEISLGVNGSVPVTENVTLLATLDATHRFEKQGAGVSGQLIGLSAFDFAGASTDQDWLHGGVGIESKAGAGKLSLMANATTMGNAPNYWLALRWQAQY